MHTYSEFEEGKIKVKVYIPSNFRKSHNFVVQYRHGRKVLKKLFFTVRTGVVLNYENNFMEELDEFVTKGLMELTFNAPIFKDGGLLGDIKELNQ